jgi:hypothetical protein
MQAQALKTGTHFDNVGPHHSPARIPPAVFTNELPDMIEFRD